MENPFEIILKRLDHIESLIKGIQINTVSQIHPEISEVMNLTQAAQYLNLAKQSIYGLTARREIPHFKKGKKLYFKKPELDQWISEGRVKAKKQIEQEVDEYLVKRGKRKTS
jgi:excisionase family DNA binding protein